MLRRNRHKICLQFLACTFILLVCNHLTRRQRAKKGMSDSPGLVDFAIGLVFLVLNLPDGQVLFLGEIQITEGLLSILPIKKGFGASWNDLWASTCYLQLAQMAGCKTDFLCTLQGCHVNLQNNTNGPRWCQLQTSNETHDNCRLPVD